MRTSSGIYPTQNIYKCNFTDGGYTILEVSLFNPGNNEKDDGSKISDNVFPCSVTIFATTKKFEIAKLIAETATKEWDAEIVVIRRMGNRLFLINLNAKDKEKHITTAKLFSLCKEKVEAFYPEYKNLGQNRWEILILVIL